MIPSARIRSPAAVLALAVALLPAFMLAACGRAAGDVELLVAAASDLAGAMPELAAAFEVETGIRVVATLGSTGQLANQLLQGAPPDVFLSADDTWVDRLVAAGRVEPSTRAIYAYGVLVLLAGRVATPPADVHELRDPAYARIALANPEHAPYGRAARQALAGAGVYDELSARVVLAENVRQTVQFAETRAVDVAMAALSLMEPDRHRWSELPAELHEPLAQTAAVVAGSRHQEAATSFVHFLTGPAGREILARHRFVLP